MSSIGMIETLAEHDEFYLVTTVGGGAQILDCDGDNVMHLTTKQGQDAAECFPLIMAVYQQGLNNGERAGRFRQQRDVQKALGLESVEHRVRKLECSVFPGEFMA